MKKKILQCVGRHINCLRSINDITTQVIVDNLESLKELIKKIAELVEETGLIINFKKSKIENTYE